MIGRILAAMFGNGRNAIKETVEVFRQNAEGAATREHAQQRAALSQFAGEFTIPAPGRFDRVMDGVNRLPRPALALGTLGLFVSAMVDPIWFAARMQGIALVPEPLWWLLGAIVTFYFGARHQTKGQVFQRFIAETMMRTGQVNDNLVALRALAKGAKGPDAGGTGMAPETRPIEGGTNPALDEWRNAS